MRTIQRDIVGAFIFSKDGKILLGNAGVYAGMLCVPGGGIHEGETKYEALKREINEETGINISQAEVTEIKGENKGSSSKTLRETGEDVFVHMNFFDYIVRLSLDATEVDLQLDDDFINADWYDPYALHRDDLAEGTKKRLVQLGFVA